MTGGAAFGRRRTQKRDAFNARHSRQDLPELRVLSSLQGFFRVSGILIPSLLIADLRNGPKSKGSQDERYYGYLLGAKLPRLNNVSVSGRRTRPGAEKTHVYTNYAYKYNQRKMGWGQGVCLHWSQPRRGSSPQARMRSWMGWGSWPARSLHEVE